MSSRDTVRRLLPRMPWNLVVYDGRCYWCHAKAHWLHERNFLHDTHERRLFYAQRQSAEGRFIQQHFPELRQVDALVLFEKLPEAQQARHPTGIRVSTKSEAVLRILAKCEHPGLSWAAAAGLWLLPRAPLDWYFDRFWARRESRFGLAPQPIELTPELKARRWKMR